MKREFLTELGLEKEAVDKIMAEHGKAIQTEKQSNEQAVAELQTKLNEANETITKASESTQTLETVQSELADYKTKYEEAQSTLTSERKTQKIKETLTAEGANDLEYLMFKLGDIEDVEKVSEMVKNLKAELPNHFANKTDTTIEGYEVLGNKLDKVEPNKTYNFEELNNLSAEEINANWETISASLTK